MTANTPRTVRAKVIAPGIVRQHFTGHIVALLRRATRGGEVSVHYGQQNGSYGIHQTLVKLADDPTDYRLILAPANAPICVHGRPIDEHFATRLGEGV